MRLLTVSDRAILPVAGVIWRSCTFAPDGAERVIHPQPAGPLVIDLPPDLAPAGEVRRSEFLAGRLCAALALTAAGRAPWVGRSGRAPVWPAGIAGSISHTAGRAMAVVSARHTAIGVDCERVLDDRTLPEVAPLVMAPEDWRLRPGGLPEPVFATLVFSAKEAAYKALSGRIDDLPEFREAVLESVSETSLTLQFRAWRLPVRYRWEGGEVVTLACLDPGAG